MGVLDVLNPRTAMAESTAGLFSYADYPLANSLAYPGDPGLFGPGSASWHVLGDVSSFIGGIRALMIQAAHPEVVAGVADHSTYEVDPLGRLSRTSSYVTATGYGAMPEVEEALSVVRRAHVPVKGLSHRGTHYSASGGDFASWVHNVLIDSFLSAHQVFGREPLSRDGADAFVAEQAKLGAMLRSTDLPTTQAGLSDWIATHPALDTSPGMEATMRFLRKPPLPMGVNVGYRALFQAAAATIPERIRELLGVTAYPGAVPAGSALIGALRWSMGSSPSWWLALERTGAPLPEGVSFRRPPPAVGATERFVRS